MKTTARILPVAILAATASVAWIAGGGPATTAAQDAQAAATPEHKLLEKYAGTWDAEVTVPDPTGGAATKTPAKSVARVACGGLWLVSDFEGSMMGGPFVGHEVFGFDPIAKRYVLTWVDSTSATPFSGEFTFDAKTRTLDGTMKGKLPTGADMVWHQTDVWKSDDERAWTMLMKGPDGKESPAVQITYKRKK
ncbi:MAG TPA: DUF1579 domain-containing protein [Planctomycetota bacterium]|nr:DUF1579 domain-containing protein [Planctomycetota bacterium]